MRDARKRRQLTMELLAERASISRTTLNKVENGDESVALGIYAAVLFVLDSWKALETWRTFPLMAWAKTWTGALFRSDPAFQKSEALLVVQQGKGVMSDLQVLVYASLKGVDHLVGNLHCHLNKGKESASFVYAKEWLANPLCFSLQPDLPPGPGAFHSQHALFGSLGDSAPDRWGRTMMEACRSQACKKCQGKKAVHFTNVTIFLWSMTRPGRAHFAFALHQ